MVAGFWRVEGLGHRRKPFEPKKRGAQRRGLTPEQQSLVVKYMPMAKAWSSPFRRYWRWSQEDFLSAAYIALVEAAVHYDPTRGIKFGSFARLRIRGALLDTQSALRDVYQTDGSQSFKPPDLSSDNDENGVLLATYDDEVGREMEAREFVEGCLQHLPPRHAKACEEIYLNGSTQKEAALAVGCSKSKLSVLHKEALELLRQSWETRVAGMDLRSIPLLND